MKLEGALEMHALPATGGRHVSQTSLSAGIRNLPGGIDVQSLLSPFDGSAICVPNLFTNLVSDSDSACHRRMTLQK